MPRGVRKIAQDPTRSGKPVGQPERLCRAPAAPAGLGVENPGTSLFPAGVGAGIVVYGLHYCTHLGHDVVDDALRHRSNR